jgi:acetyl esterase/lipase
MHIERHSLRPDNPAVYLDAYLGHDSPEFFTGRLRPAVIVCPGGSYQYTSDREAEPIALRFLAHGYHAFVLRYSVRARFPQPMLDLANAIRLVRQNAAAWLVDPQRLIVCGFSAGGHLAAALGVFWDRPFILDAVHAAPADLRPDAVILGYPVMDLRHGPPAKDGGEPHYAPMHGFLFGVREAPDELVNQYRPDLHVTPQSSPAFIWHTADDPIVSARNSLLFANALAAHGVPYELHIFDTGPHGLALANSVTAVDASLDVPHAQIWLDLALNWLDRQSRRLGVGYN